MAEQNQSSQNNKPLYAGMVAGVLVCASVCFAALRGCEIENQTERNYAERGYSRLSMGIYVKMGDGAASVQK